MLIGDNLGQNIIRMQEENSSMGEIKCDYESWLKLATKLFVDNVDKEETDCPCCRQKGLDFQCIGKEDNRYGFMLFWCWKCRKGIKISRLKIPDGVSMLPMEVSDEEYMKRIPKFQFIEAK